jgi:hypothetical protein
MSPLGSVEEMPDVNAIDVDYFEHWGKQGVRLSMASGAYFSGDLIPASEDDLRPSIHFYGIYVPVDERGTGVASRLVAKMAEIAVEHGATYLLGHVESQHMIKVFRKLVGDENLDFATFDPVESTTHQVPLTPDQAIASLERAENHEENLEARAFGIDIDVRL